MPPIFIGLAAHQQSCHQYFSDWWHIGKVATNIYRIGGTSAKLPPIIINNGGNEIFLFYLCGLLDLNYFFSFLKWLSLAV
ncbi:hypothetical protein WKV52_11040 [Tetragenococcus halophilus]